jgi:hypothetical protein
MEVFYSQAHKEHNTPTANPPARTHTHADLHLYVRQHYVTSHAELQLKLCHCLELVNGSSWLMFRTVSPILRLGGTPFERTHNELLIHFGLYL